MVQSSPSLRRLLVVSAASLGLLAAAGPALALSTDEAIKTATAACLDSAGKQGWRTDLAKVISSRSVDADKVEVVFDLTKDGTNTARLTCPYSLSKGVGAAFGGDTTPAAEPAAEPTTTADAGTPVDGNRAWWLLLPLGLGLLSWAALRGRNDGATAYGDASTSGTTYSGSYTTGTTTTTGTTYGTTTSRNISVEANAHDGQLDVREQPDITSGILRRVRNGDTVLLTGHRRHDWLEVVNGGWVRDIDLRYDRSTVRFS